MSKRLFVGDFETSTQKWLTYDDCARVWLWDICEIGEKYRHVANGTNIDTFFEYLQSRRKSGDNKTVYFHNLKYDGSYILNYLLLHGYQWCDTSKKMPPQSFATLISSEGQFYSIIVCFARHGKTDVKVTFLDSLKKFPQSARAIAVAYKLPILKGDIDYNLYRPQGYKPTQEEYNYIFNDTEIIARALSSKLDLGLDRMTRAADALQNFTASIGGKDVLRELFPVLDKSVDDNIRKAYRGGYVYLNPQFANKVLNNATSYDVNSLFPSVMRYEPLPYGEPREFDGKYIDNPKYPLYIQYFTCEFNIKHGKLPTVQIKNTGRFSETEYLTTSGEDGGVFLAMTNIDLKIFLERYDVKNIEYIGGYMFKARKGIFNKYIDFWISQKIAANDNPPLRQNAKDMLNSLYGKFAKRVDVKSKRPELNADGALTFTTFDDKEGEPLYTALACFVTAYARQKTQTCAQAFHNEERYIYSDTDSVHVLGSQPEWLDVDSVKLGAWKNEGTAEKAKFLRAKTYIKEKHGKINVTCAGMPDNVKSICTFEVFKGGQTFGEKFVQKQVKGGCVLCETDFTIALQ